MTDLHVCVCVCHATKGCGKAFSQLSNLQSHSRSHMTDRPFRCNSCYKCYADEQSLREHIPKHSDTKHLKTHICHICGKSYTQVSSDLVEKGVGVRVLEMDGTEEGVGG